MHIYVSALNVKNISDNFFVIQIEMKLRAEPGGGMHLSQGGLIDMTSNTCKPDHVQLGNMMSSNSSNAIRTNLLLHAGILGEEDIAISNYLETASEAIWCSLANQLRNARGILGRTVLLRIGINLTCYEHRFLDWKDNKQRIFRPVSNSMLFDKLVEVGYAAHGEGKFSTSDRRIPSYGTSSTCFLLVCSSDHGVEQVVAKAAAPITRNALNKRKHQLDILNKLNDKNASVVKPIGPGLIRVNTTTVVLMLKKFVSDESDMSALPFLNKNGINAVFSQICNTLAISHSEGITHGNLSLRAILYEKIDGTLQVCSWGRAEREGVDSPHKIICTGEPEFDALDRKRQDQVCAAVIAVNLLARKMLKPSDAISRKNCMNEETQSILFEDSIEAFNLLNFDPSPDRVMRLADPFIVAVKGLLNGFLDFHAASALLGASPFTPETPIPSSTAIPVACYFDMAAAKMSSEHLEMFSRKCVDNNNNVIDAIGLRSTKVIPSNIFLLDYGGHPASDLDIIRLGKHIPRLDTHISSGAGGGGDGGVRLNLDGNNEKNGVRCNRFCAAVGRVFEPHPLFSAFHSIRSILFLIDLCSVQAGSKVNGNVKVDLQQKCLVPFKANTRYEKQNRLGCALFSTQIIPKKKELFISYGSQTSQACTQIKCNFFICLSRIYNCSSC